HLSLLPTRPPPRPPLFPYTTLFRSHRLDRRLFRLRDFFCSSSLARGRHRLHPPCRNPPQPRNALHRHRHPWRHGHASQSLSSLQDRKSTRLNSSHVKISYAVFCLKK